MIEIEPLASGRYLLGFSGGVDSSALFFLLLESNVEFDIAIVDYGVREQSKEEVEYAKSLAKKYGKKCFHTQAPKFQSNFEAQAREFRYEFFYSLVLRYCYDGVILAHQLDDRFEWMMMQFCKGSGLNTLLGYELESEYRGIKIFRPLLKIAKKVLYEYCKVHCIIFFEDESNQEERYLRNSFRKHLQPLIAEYSRGIMRSFEYLSEEKKKLYTPKAIYQFFEITFWERGSEIEDIHLLDLQIKKRGYILSAKQKQEIVRCCFSCEIIDFVVESSNSKIFLLPKKEAKMSTKFRDFARRQKIPKRLRAYLFACVGEQSMIVNFLREYQIG